MTAVQTCCEFHTDDGCSQPLEPCCDACPALLDWAGWTRKSPQHPTAHWAVPLSVGWRTACGQRWSSGDGPVPAASTGHRCARCVAKEGAE